MTTVSVAVGGNSYGHTCSSVPAGLWNLKPERDYRVVFTDEKPVLTGAVYKFKRGIIDTDITVIGATRQLNLIGYRGNTVYLMLDTRAVLAQAFGIIRENPTYGLSRWPVPEKGWVWCEEA